jgi:hypothetical protein
MMVAYPMICASLNFTCVQHGFQRVKTIGFHALAPPRYLNNEQFSDVSFLVEGRRLMAHRMLLTLFSDYFRGWDVTDLGRRG